MPSLILDTNELGSPTTTDELSPEQMATAQTEQREIKIKWNELMGNESEPVQHKKTSVLMLYWDPEYSDQNAEQEVFALRDVFQQDYRFKVITQKLDTRSYPEPQAFRHLSNFVYEEDDENGLLIVYYAGHGGSEANEMGQISFTGKWAIDEHEKKYHSIDWENVEGVLKKTRSDVIEIFDCCHAGRLCTPARNITRCFEVLTACDPKSRTPAPGPHSFTQAMTWALKDLKSKEGFTTTDLHAHICKAPDFSRNQVPMLFGRRFEAHNNENIYIAPMPKPGEQHAGPFRAEVEQDVKHEEMLDLRFHFAKAISEKDLIAIAKALKKIRCSHNLRFTRVSAIGKYKLANYNLAWRSRAQHATARWKEHARRKSSTTNRARPTMTTRASTAATAGSSRDNSLVESPTIEPELTGLHTPVSGDD